MCRTVSVGSARHLREIYSYRRFLPYIFILPEPYSPKGNSHLEHNASIDADFPKEVPFGVSRFTKKILGSYFPPNLNKFQPLHKHEILE
jgi:hypothetical protein